MLYYLITKLYLIVSSKISTITNKNKAFIALLIIGVIVYIYNLSRSKLVPYLDENGKQKIDENGNPIFVDEKVVRQEIGSDGKVYLVSRDDEIRTEKHKLYTRISKALILIYLATRYHFNDLKIWEIPLILIILFGYSISGDRARGDIFSI
jgi:hypothetical protein